MNKEVVIVEIDGELLAWVNGQFFGHPFLIEAAKGLAAYGDTNTKARLYIPLSDVGPDIIPSSDNALGGTAALLGVSEELATILYAPQSVTTAIEIAKEGGNLVDLDFMHYAKIAA